MDKLSSLNWIGICILFLGIVAFMLGKQEGKYTTFTVVACIAGVILFILGFYIKK